MRIPPPPHTHTRTEPCTHPAPCMPPGTHMHRLQTTVPPEIAGTRLLIDTNTNTHTRERERARRVEERAKAQHCKLGVIPPSSVTVIPSPSGDHRGVGEVNTGHRTPHPREHIPVSTDAREVSHSISFCLGGSYPHTHPAKASFPDTGRNTIGDQATPHRRGGRREGGVPPWSRNGLPAPALVSLQL